jgi:small conductance mechanosensitive channel
LSDRKLRRAEIDIAISYGDDVDVARRAILAVLTKEKRIATDPAPSVFVNELGDSAVVLKVWFWAKYADLFSTTIAMREALYKELPKKKIHFPFPQMDVHIQK